MEHIRLTDTSHSLFKEAWELYEQAFPLAERRPRAWQHDIMSHAHYHFELILEEEALVGFLLWWSFEELRYLEHFAIHPMHRGKGFGKQLLDEFKERDERPVLLEVEPPQEILQQRRIGFYQRAGFHLSSHFYQQPPYHAGQPPLTLLLMAFPQPVTADEVAHFTCQRHPLIYRLA